MKRIMVLIAACIFMSLLARSQSASDGEKAMDRLSAAYNKEDYHSLYLMLSPEFQRQMPEAQMQSFFKNSLRGAFGNILSWKLTSSKSSYKYAVHMDRGELDLDLYLSQKQEIAGMRWLPAKKATSGKKRDPSAIRSNNPRQTPLQKLLDSLAIEHLQDPVNCGLSISVIKDGKADFYFYGSVSKSKDKLPDTATLYEIGSVTKTFTAIVLAHAINEKKLQPGDDIRKYLPGSYPNLEYKGKPITIEHLSNHTSGLPRIPAEFDRQKNFDVQDPYKNYTKEMFLEYLARVKIEVEPGTVSEYSNYGVAVLGMILEQVYHKSITELIAMYVTNPAGMRHTVFDVSGSEKDLRANGYNEEGKEVKFWTLGLFNAAGGLKSNISDMTRYLQANMQDINADFSLTHQSTFTDAHNSIGLNWIISTAAGKQTIIWHNGETGGFHSYVGYSKQQNAGVVILSNSATETEYIAKSLLEIAGKDELK